MSTTHQASQQASMLRAVSGRPPLGDYIHQLWQRRFFVGTRAKSLALSQHQGTLLGNLWLVLAPTLDGLVYYFIFGVLFHGSKAVPNFFAYLIIGMFLFSFTNRCINQGTSSIQGSMGLIRAFSFPRAAVPLAVVARELIALAPILAAMFVLIMVIPPHALPQWTWLLLPAVILLQTMFNLGATFITARIGAIFPDAKTLIPFILRLWLYLSCVMLHISIFDRMSHTMGALARLNPMYVVLDSARILLIDGNIPSPAHWLQMLAWGVGTLVVGFLFFWQKEVRYGRPN